MNVSWQDVTAYSHWLSQTIQQDCRLPSEAEWEYAARAGTVTRYSWGDELIRNKANCSGCGSEWGEKQTAPVGSFQANDWGLKDMHGNEWEWTQDCYVGRYQDTPKNGDAYEELSVRLVFCAAALGAIRRTA